MNNVNGSKINVNQGSLNSIPKQPAEDLQNCANEEPAQLSDFSDPKAEVLGRSMLIKDADNINHDLRAVIENPQITENSDKMFETALSAAQKAGLENPYEEAASFATSTI